MGRGMLRNTMYVLLYPQGPTLQAAGDELVISPWKVPFLTVHTAKNLGSWLDFSSESLDNTESWSMQGNSPIILFFQKENRFPAGDSLIQTLSLPQRSHIPHPGQQDTLACQSQQEQ